MGSSLRHDLFSDALCNVRHNPSSCDDLDYVLFPWLVPEFLASDSLCQSNLQNLMKTGIVVQVVRVSSDLDLIQR